MSWTLGRTEMIEPDITITVIRSGGSRARRRGARNRGRGHGNRNGNGEARGGRGGGISVAAPPAILAPVAAGVSNHRARRLATYEAQKTASCVAEQAAKQAAIACATAKQTLATAEKEYEVAEEMEKLARAKAREVRTPPVLASIAWNELLAASRNMTAASIAKEMAVKTEALTAEELISAAIAFWVPRTLDVDGMEEEGVEGLDEEGGDVVAGVEEWEGVGGGGGV